MCLSECRLQAPNFCFEIEICPTYSSCFDAALAFAEDVVIDSIVDSGSQLAVVIVTVDDYTLVIIMMIVNLLEPSSIIWAKAAGNPVWLTMV